MSIVINTDLTYIMTKLNIPESKIETDYANKSIEEIIQAEAASGNQAAIAMANEILTNVNFVIELFKLADPNNKLAILKDMTAQQMQTFLPLMDPKDLVQGLYFFTEDKLMKMLQDVPKEQLVKVVFQMFSQEDIIKLMPDEQLNKFLDSTTLDKNDVLKNLQSLPPEYLQQVIEQITGESLDDGQNQNQSLNGYDLANKIGAMKPREYHEALKSLLPEQKSQLVLSLAKEHPEQFQLFDADAYTKIIYNQKQKDDMVKAMAALDSEQVIKMLNQLPNDLLSIVVTQTDTESFADNIMKRFPEVLAHVLAGG